MEYGQTPSQISRPPYSGAQLPCHYQLIQPADEFPAGGARVGWQGRREAEFVAGQVEQLVCFGFFFAAQVGRLHQLFLTLTPSSSMRSSWRCRPVIVTAGPADRTPMGNRNDRIPPRPRPAPTRIPGISSSSRRPAPRRLRARQRIGGIKRFTEYREAINGHSLGATPSCAARRG